MTVDTAQATLVAEGPLGRATWRRGPSPDPKEGPGAPSDPGASQTPHTSSGMDPVPPAPEPGLPEGMRTLAGSAEEIAAIRARSTDPQKRGMIGITTGIPTVDEVLGGLMRGGSHLFAAGSGVGKSLWALTLMLAAARAGHRVLYANFEMRTDQFLARTLSAIAQLESQSILLGKIQPAELALIDHAWAHMQHLDVVVDYVGGQDVRAFLKRVEIVHALAPIDELIVDYIALLRYAGLKGHEALDLITQELVQWAKQHNVALVLLSQINSNKERDERADNEWQQGDIAGARAVYNHVDVTGFLSREQVQKEGAPEETQKAKLNIKKGRDGGERIIPLIMRPSCARFEADGAPPPPCCGAFAALVDAATRAPVAETARPLTAQEMDDDEIPF